MRTEDLVRFLQTQAEEIHQWPLPQSLPDRKRRAGSGRTATLLVASVVAVVLVVLAVPTLLTSRGEPHQPTPSPPAASPHAPAVDPRDWTATDCAPTSFGGCATPDVLTSRGVRYHARSGGVVPTRASGRRSTDLSLRVGAGPARVLVGAVGSRATSRLYVRFGDGPPTPVSAGRLSLLPIPTPGPRPVTVTVEERSPSPPRETLTIEEYRPQ